MLSRDDLLWLGQLAVDAGAEIMAVRARGFKTRTKADKSVVTEADEAAEAIILAGLAQRFPHIPVLAEESAAAGTVFSPGPSFFCVDPLDGTRGFASGGDDFTVNIGLIQDRQALAGVIYLPVTGELFIGEVGLCAWRMTVLPGQSVTAQIPIAIRTRAYPHEGLVATISSQHLDKKTKAWVEQLPDHVARPFASSLKFCRLAEGVADVYPRFAPTMEWDTAAGHAILLAAGGSMSQPDGSAFVYGKSETGYLNTSFVAWGNQPLVLDGDHI